MDPVLDVGHCAVLEFLLRDCEIEIGCVTEEGSAPVHIASYAGHFDALQLLVSLGADLLQPDKDGLVVSCLNPGRL